MWTNQKETWCTWLLTQPSEIHSVTNMGSAEGIHPKSVLKTLVLNPKMGLKGITSFWDQPHQWVSILKKEEPSYKSSKCRGCASHVPQQPRVEWEHQIVVPLPTTRKSEVCDQRTSFLHVNLVRGTVPVVQAGLRGRVLWGLVCDYGVV